MRERRNSKDVQYKRRFLRVETYGIEGKRNKETNYRDYQKRYRCYKKSYRKEKTSILKKPSTKLPGPNSTSCEEGKPHES